MKTYHWGCPACGLADIPADDINAAKESLEVHEYAVHKGKQVGVFGCTFPQGPTVPYWPKVPVKVSANGTYTVGGVLHGPTSSKGWKVKTNEEAA